MDALSSYVEAHWHRPLAVVDRATGASELYGPRYSVTAFIFDTGTLSTDPCISDITNRRQDAANLVPPHAPFLVVTVTVASTATRTGTTPGPTTITVDGDPRSFRENDRVTLQALVTRVFTAP